jgi:hypothetical protein
VVGDIEVTNRIGEISLKLLDSEAYTVDARAKIGEVSSDFGGSSRRSYLINERLISDYRKKAHRLHLRVGIGAIGIQKLSS